MNYTLHNIDELIRDDDGGLTIHRFPLQVINSLDTDLGKKNARYILSGCELRFVINSGEAEISIEYSDNELYSPKVYLYFGSFQGAWEWETSVTLYKGVNKFSVSYPYSMENLMNLAKNNAYIFSPKVVRVILPSGIRLMGVEGDIRKPTAGELPKKRIVFYGSSITAGASSLNESAAFPSVCGRILDADVYNKGMPGSCRLEKSVVDFIFGYNADLYFAELGTNCYDNKKNGWFKERVLNVLETHQRLCSDKPLLVIDLFRMVKEPECCTIVKDAVSSKMWDNVVYVSGDDILDDAKYYSCDMVHPSIDAHYMMAEKIAEIIKENFKAFN